MPGRRDEIAAKAYEMTGDHGLESVHARTVATALGINHATVHYYFPKRVDLLKAVAEEALRRLSNDRAAFYEGMTKPDDKLSADFELTEDYAMKGSRFFRVIQGLFVASLEEPSLKPLAKKIWTAWADGIGKNVASAKVKKSSPFGQGDLLAATLLGIGLVSQLHDGKWDAAGNVNNVKGNLTSG
ncbi:MAG: TetR/AcrR family transcriptional regulator [Fimbriimonadaceae bacterium]|nr:TetR/AcrR family transcriptional regulator [Fimbriimonadaceae bacterium]